MIISIIIGLLICFALPIFLEGRMKKIKKTDMKAIVIACKILGLTIIAVSIIRFFV